MSLLRSFVTAVALAAAAVPCVSAAAAETLRLGTATPGGGFELFGGVLADVVNAEDRGVTLQPVATKGSRQNIPFLEAGELDVALVASLPAIEAFQGAGRDAPTPLKIVTAIYSTFGAFAVAPSSSAQTFDDLIGQRVAWGTASSGLTLLGKYVTEALGLDRDADFQASYLEKAGLGAPMVLNGDVDALWGGGVGWPNFTKIAEAGGRLVGLSDAQAHAVADAVPFLQTMTIPAGAYPGQAAPLTTVGSFSYILARPDLADDTVYALAKAIHAAQPALAERLRQGRETLPENTVKAALEPDHIHPGARRYLRELGLM
jgi:TRAP transporter TAXI family solute receptor